MIKTGSTGSVIVEIEGKSYDFGNSEQFIQFLLYVTTPSPEVALDQSAFAVDSAVGDEEKVRLERYSAFLETYARKRESLLESSPGKMRERDIEDLIKELENPTAL